MVNYNFTARVNTPKNIGEGYFEVASNTVPYEIVYMPPYPDSEYRKEVVIIFKDRIPSMEKEPALYCNGKYPIEQVGGDIKIETHFIVMWLTTKESDTKILLEHPEYIQHELFRCRLTGDDVELVSLLEESKN